MSSHNHRTRGHRSTLRGTGGGRRTDAAAAAGAGVRVSVAGKTRRNGKRIRRASLALAPSPAGPPRRPRRGTRVAARAGAAGGVSECVCRLPRCERVGRTRRAGGRAAGAVVLKTEKRLYTTTGVGTEPQRSDAGRDTRADGADPRGGGGAVLYPLYPSPRFEPIPRHALVCRTRRNRCSESLLG